MNRMIGLLWKWQHRQISKLIKHKSFQRLQQTKLQGQIISVKLRKLFVKLVHKNSREGLHQDNSQVKERIGTRVLNMKFSR